MQARRMNPGARLGVGEYELLATTSSSCDNDLFSLSSLSVRKHFSDFA